MIGNDGPLLPAHDPVFLFLAHQDLLHCFEQILLVDQGPVVLDRVDGCLVDHVGKIRAHGAGGGQGDLVQIHRLVHLYVLGVDLEDGHASLEVGPLHDDPSVKTAGAQQCLVQDLGPVGGPYDQDALGGIETVHFGQELVEGLFTLFVAAVAGVAAAADGVDLVDKDDAGSVLGGLLEKVTDTGCAHAYVELYEIGACQGKEGHVGFACHGLGQQSLASSGRAHQQGSLGKLGADLGISAGVVEEIHHFLQRLLGLVLAGHVLEGDAGILLNVFLGRALAHVSHQASASAHSAEKEGQDAPHEKDGKDIGQEDGHDVGGAVGDLGGYQDALFQHALGQGGVVLGLANVKHGLGIPQMDLQTVGVDLHFLHLALVHVFQELIVVDLGALGIGPEEPADGGQGNDGRDQKDDQVLPGLGSPGAAFALTAFGAIAPAGASAAAASAAAAAVFGNAAFSSVLIFPKKIKKHSFLRTAISGGIK